MLPHIVDKSRVQSIHTLEGGIDGLGGAAHGPGQTAHRKRLRPLSGHQSGGSLQNILLKNSLLRRQTHITSSCSAILFGNHCPPYFGGFDRFSSHGEQIANSFLPYF